MNFVKRRGMSAANMPLAKFEAVKEHFVIGINAFIKMEDIP